MENNGSSAPDLLDWLAHWSVVAAGVVVSLVLTAGYVMNAVKVATQANESAWLEFLRGLGLLLLPLGALLGWI